MCYHYTTPQFKRYGRPPLEHLHLPAISPQIFVYLVSNTHQGATFRFFRINRHSVSLHPVHLQPGLSLTIAVPALTADKPLIRVYCLQQDWLCVNRAGFEPARISATISAYDSHESADIHPQHDRSAYAIPPPVQLPARHRLFTCFCLSVFILQQDHPRVGLPVFTAYSRGSPLVWVHINPRCVDRAGFEPARVLVSGITANHPSVTCYPHIPSPVHFAPALSCLHHCWVPGRLFQSLFQYVPVGGAAVRL